MDEIILEYERLKNKMCGICGEQCKVDRKNAQRMYCANKICPQKNKKFHILKGTIFYKMQISKKTILRIIELWAVKASKNIISYVIGADRKTIWRVLRRVANILVPSYYSAMNEIGGSSQIIEIDESKFGRRKYNRGHHVDGVWILGMVEKTGKKRIKLIQVEDRSLKTLTSHITASINKDSRIYTDGWKAYNNLGSKFISHETVNHSRHFKDPISGVHTNTIEGSWAGIKMHVPPRGRSKALINMYLVRYMLGKNENIHPFEAVIKYLL